MRINIQAGSRRLLLRGLLFMIIAILAVSGWVTGTDPGLKPQALQAAGVQLTDKSPTYQVAPAAELQKLPAGNVSSPDTPSLSVQSRSKNSKTVYLTFDDGPSPVTSKVLDILEREGVKATFFVLGNGAKRNPELINAIWEQGHAIGNHTYDHNYRELYSGFIPFWKQIKRTEEIIREITGTRPQLIRAPGGTSGHFDDTYFYLLKQAGYVVTDWNVDSGDSKRRGVPAAEIIRESVPNTTAANVVLLLHDGGGHEESAKALPAIIARYKAAGYTFDVLDPQDEPVQFKVSSGSVGAGRVKPSAAWIASNITTNRALFEPGKPLALEVGKLETKLSPGEYLIHQGQYVVPMRAVIERLGGKVTWEAATHSSRVTLNGRSILADVENKKLSGTTTIKPGYIKMIGGATWISLRDLLETLGHPILKVSATAKERRVKMQ
jgi:peptidoglycan-N-acetylglucosamine deacetylase